MKFSYAVLEKLIFGNFRGLFYDDVIMKLTHIYDQTKKKKLFGKIWLGRAARLPTPVTVTQLRRIDD